MRRTICCSIAAVTALVASACVMAPRSGVSMPRSASVVAADARALRYGSTAPEVFDNPQLRDKLRGLFGADWAPGGPLAFGAPAYFPASSSIRMVRVGADEYIALTGCVPTACPTHRGLLLIRPDGDQLMARLDEGGYLHYYDHGPGVAASAVPRSSIDGAWMALERIEPR